MTKPAGFSPGQVELGLGRRWLGCSLRLGRRRQVIITAAVINLVEFLAQLQPVQLLAGKLTYGGTDGLDGVGLSAGAVLPARGGAVFDGGYDCA
jgi:hypothetical protein